MEVEVLVTEAVAVAVEVFKASVWVAEDGGGTVVKIVVSKVEEPSGPTLTVMIFEHASSVSSVC